MSPVALAPVVNLDGRVLAPAWQQALVEIRVEHRYQVPSRCSLRFADPGYALLAASSVSLGTSIEVKDADDSTVLINAEVTSVAVEQRQGEHPELVVVAHDKSHRLGRATDVKTYMSMSYSDVVSTLAEDCGLSPDVDSTSITVDYLMQADSDLGLLTELARRVGFDWWTDGSSLCFKKPAAGTSVSLVLGDELLSFSVRASGHGPDSVTVDGWDRSQQEQVTSTSSSASEGVTASSDLASLVTSPGSAFGMATLLSAGLHAQSQSEAAQLSQALLDRASACSVSAQGVATGTGKLKLGVSAGVSQAGPASGDYPVTRVEHLFRPGSGYVTRFYSGDRLPSTLLDTLAGTRVASPATLHNGLSVGIVTNVNDPDENGRVKVTFPGLDSSYETGWARVVGVGGGANRGSVFIPEVNDEVLVGFEGGDPRQPVVIGGLYGSKSTIPSPNIQDGKVQQRAITSRLGHVVSLLDGDEMENQAILLQLAGAENSIHLGKDKLTITVPDATPVEITAGDSSIKIGSDGSISMSAPQVSITADEKISLSAPQIALAADAQLSLQSDGTASIEGATISIESEGPLSASGEPVSINA